MILIFIRLKNVGRGERISFKLFADFILIRGEIASVLNRFPVIESEWFFSVIRKNPAAIELRGLVGSGSDQKIAWSSHVVSRVLFFSFVCVCDSWNSRVDIFLNS